MKQTGFAVLVLSGVLAVLPFVSGPVFAEDRDRPQVHTKLDNQRDEKDKQERNTPSQSSADTNRAAVTTVVVEPTYRPSMPAAMPASRNAEPVRTYAPPYTARTTVIESPRTWQQHSRPAMPATLDNGSQTPQSNAPQTWRSPRAQGQDPSTGRRNLPAAPKGYIYQDNSTQDTAPRVLRRENITYKPNPFRSGVTRSSLPSFFPRVPRRPIILPGTVIDLSDYGTTVYNGYQTLWVPGNTYVSPFWMYNCPPYIGSSIVITSPYTYLNGRESYSFSAYDDEDSYYSGNAYRGRRLRAALNDLRRYWEENDVRSLRRHLSTNGVIAIFQDEKYLYSLRRPEFLSLAGDALDRVNTLSFRFHSTRDRTDGLVNAYATQRFRVGEDGDEQTAEVRYTLIYANSTWYVSAVSLSPEATQD